VNISASYAEDAEQKVGIHRGQEKTYFDIYNNETRQESIVISFDAYDMENDGDYSLTFRLYQIEDEGANYLLGMTLSTFHASYNLVSLNASPGWIEGAEYKFTLGLYLDWGNVTESGFATYYFTEGSPPVLTSPGCTDLNATNYDANATVDDGSCEYKDTDNDGVFDHLEIEGCTDRNATNFDANATEDDKTCEFEDTDQDGVFDHLEITGCMDINATNFDSNATDDDGTCNYLDTDGDGIFDHLEIEGCLDSDAANYNPDATDSGACTYPEFSVDIVTDQTTGMAPLMISFEADISGGNPPYEIEWIFGDGVTSTRASVKHTFDAGIYTVVLQVTDDDGIMLQKSIPIIASGIPSTDELSGYFTDTGQLEPIDKGMVATFEFTGVADGGEGPYTFVWDFGDGDGAEGGGVVLHQYAEYSEYTVKLTIMDSTGESVQVERKIYISPDENGDDGGLTNANDAGDGDNNFDIYATGAGVIGLLLIFGLFGRKRNQGFLDEERRKIHGEGSIWDEP
jgi:PKD repeat protein